MRLSLCQPGHEVISRQHTPGFYPCACLLALADAELDEDWAVEQGRDAEDAYFDDDA